MTSKRHDPVNSLMRINFSGGRPKMSEPAVDDILKKGRKLCGLTFGEKYRLIDVIGHGGMGCVFLARHVNIEMRSALKVLLSEHANERVSIKRFQQEASVLVRIGHPNIVSVLDCGSGPSGEPYIVMELLKGKDLGELMGYDQAPVPWVVAKRILLQSCKALSAAHQRGVIHRDIKPANIFLVDPTGECVVKVLDFGLAKIEDHSAKGHAEGFLGTPMYVAPEQAAGAGDCDLRVDIYSLGVVMYQMLTGHTPFESSADSEERRIEEIIDMHKDLSLAAPRFATKRTDLVLPTGAEEIVLRALAKRANERFRSMSELLHALEGCEIPANAPERVAKPIPLDKSIPQDSGPPRLDIPPGMTDLSVIRSFQELGAREHANNRNRGDSSSVVRALLLLGFLSGAGVGGYYVARHAGCIPGTEVVADASLPQRDAGVDATEQPQQLDAGKRVNGKKPKPGKVKPGKKKKDKPGFSVKTDAAVPGASAAKKDAEPDEETGADDSKDEGDTGGSDEKEETPSPDAE